ncbi:MAG: hypothetical protein KatS3mg127_0107 [Silanimonas sp.]|nr:MAG: hypothetical protein KatS3mg127_0107 [Silanimonas sp.]
MKRRTLPDPALADAPVPLAPGVASRLEGLVAALASLRGPEEFRRFLIDLCTPAELEAMADRWAVVPALADGRAYREIHERTGVSVTTIGRVARCLALGAGGYRVAAERLGHLAPGVALAAPQAEALAPAAHGPGDTH